MEKWKKGIAKLTVPTPFAVGDVHCYLIKGDRLTLVDAGVKTEEAWEALKDQLAELKLTPKDIEQVILTHHHPNHVEKPKTAFEICQSLFPKVYQKELNLTISETAAQLDNLLSLEEIAVVEEGTTLLYAAK